MYFPKQANKTRVGKKWSSLITICHQYHDALTSSFQDRLENKSYKCHTDKFLVSKEDYFTHNISESTDVLSLTTAYYDQSFWKNTSKVLG